MLNVALVQKHISQQYLEVAKKYPNNSRYYNDATYAERSLLGGWGLRSLPSTCSAAELSMEHTYEALAQRIAQLLRNNYKYAQCSSTSNKTSKLLEKFGFKKVTSYMGNHRAKVHVYYINLENVKF